DVHWSYNNVRIKEGDEWKAAFHTNHADTFPNLKVYAQEELNFHVLFKPPRYFISKQSFRDTSLLLWEPSSAD
ncbi:hypothetical protein L208DRAFT_1266542, partial [Tricholoma matsutake]